MMRVLLGRPLKASSAKRDALNGAELPTASLCSSFINPGRTEMPFDGVGFSANEYSQKIDAVIDLIGTPERWGKGTFRSKDGRYCLRGAIRKLDKSEVLDPVVLDAINQVTGRSYFTIVRFNDSNLTNHAMILTVLMRARENIAAGRFRMTAKSAIRVSFFRRWCNRVTA
jgi:hypothetical protein